MNINTQQLRYFMELAKCLNFTRAAANLYVAQPTLSQQIAELESQLGISLFTRNSRSVSLTPAGAILQNAYPTLVAQMKQIQQRMLTTAAGFSGSLTIGFLDIFLDSIPLIMRDLKASFPDIAVKPVQASLNELHDGLNNQTLDISLTLIQDFAPEEQASFTSKLMLRDSMCFVLPGESSATEGYTFTEHKPLVMLSQAVATSYYPHVHSCLKDLGIRASNVMFVDSLGDIRAYLESGTGYSVLPASLAAFFSPSTQFIPVPDQYLNYGALWNPDSANPALPLFLEALDQFLYPEANDTEEGLS